MARLLALALTVFSMLALAQGAKPAAAPAKKGAPVKKGADAGHPDAGLSRGPGAIPSPSGFVESSDGGAKADIAPAEKAKTRYFEGMGRTPAEVAQLEELSKTL